MGLLASAQRCPQLVRDPHGPPAPDGRHHDIGRDQHLVAAPDFLGGAVMDDVLTIVTRPKEMRGASMTLSQEVRRGDDVLVAADVTVAAVRGGRAVRIPDELRAALTVSGS